MLKGSKELILYYQKYLLQILVNLVVKNKTTFINRNLRKMIGLNIDDEKEKEINETILIL